MRSGRACKHLPAACRPKPARTPWSTSGKNGVTRRHYQRCGMTQSQPETKAFAKNRAAIILQQHYRYAIVGGFYRHIKPQRIILPTECSRKAHTIGAKIRLKCLAQITQNLLIYNNTKKIFCQQQKSSQNLTKSLFLQKKNNRSPTGKKSPGPGRLTTCQKQLFERPCQ